MSPWEPRILHLSVLLALNMTPLIPNPVFCNLERVDLPCYANELQESMFYPVIVLGSSSLAEVVIHTDDEMINLEETDQWLPRADPRQCQWELLVNRLLPFAGQLRKLSLRSNAARHPKNLLTAGPISRLLVALSGSMTHLDISRIQLSQIAIAGLKSLSNLTKLRLSVDDQALGGPVPSSTPDISLPSLHTLHLTVTSLESGRRFLTRLVASQLQGLTLHVDLGPSVHGEVDPGLLISALGQWTSTNMLSKLTITMHTYYLSSDSSGGFNFCITDTTFLPLTHFSNITHVSIRPSIHHLSDEGLVAALSGWKDLRELALYGWRTKTCANEELGLSLGGVYKALLQCPLLRHLVLECDFRDVPPSSSSSETSHHEHPTHWNVGCSPITSGRFFAEWASVRLPALERVDYFDYLKGVVAGDYERAWRMAKVSLSYLDQWNNVPKLLGTGRKV
jgi:hypothetical protein